VNREKPDQELTVITGCPLPEYSSKMDVVEAGQIKGVAVA